MNFYPAHTCYVRCRLRQIVKTNLLLSGMENLITDQGQHNELHRLIWSLILRSITIEKTAYASGIKNNSEDLNMSKYFHKSIRIGLRKLSNGHMTTATLEINVARIRHTIFRNGRFIGTRLYGPNIYDYYRQII